MKTRSLILLALALVIAPLSAEQEPEVDIDKLVIDFGRLGGNADFDMLLIHLNDLTTDALFEPPQKYILRAQARGQTMFLLRGTALRDATLNVDFQMFETGALGIENFRTQMISIDRLVNGTEFSAGEEFTGIIALEGSISLSSRMTLTSGLIRFVFEFTPNMRQQLQQD